MKTWILGEYAVRSYGFVSHDSLRYMLRIPRQEVKELFELIQTEGMSMLTDSLQNPMRTFCRLTLHHVLHTSSQDRPQDPNRSYGFIPSRRIELWGLGYLDHQKFEWWEKSCGWVRRDEPGRDQRLADRSAAYWIGLIKKLVRAMSDLGVIQHTVRTP